MNSTKPRLRPTPRRIAGLAVGSIWLVAVSTVFGVWALVAISTPMAWLALSAMAVGATAVVAFGILVVRAARGIRTEARGADEPALGRRFALIVGVEVAAFGVVNTWAASTGRFSLIPSLDLIIVGLHFFPLASLFKVPRYHLMALGFCAVPAITLAAFPPEFLIGQAEGWYVVPSLGCGLVAGATAVASLREAWQSVSTARARVSAS